VAAPNATIPVHSWSATGAETHIDAVIAAKGNGGTAAQVADNTSTGGNKRGTHHVDWQRSRNAANQVASGPWSVIGGGDKNRASTDYAAVLGGEFNHASGFWSAILGGSYHIASGKGAVVLGGNRIAAGSYTGYGSSATGVLSLIGNGELNVASATLSCVLTGSLALAYLYGHTVSSAFNFGVAGSAQRGDLCIGRAITGNTIAEIFLDGASAQLDLGTSNRVVGVVMLVTATINSVGNGTGALATCDTFAGLRFFAIKRKTNDAGTALVGAGGQTLGTDIVDTNMAGCAITISADTSTGSAKIQFTPPTLAGTTTVTRVSGRIMSVEVIPV
jgi:hypothetical protein